MKIALAIPSLCAGGAERVITRMASYWAEAGHTVTVITLRPVEEDFYTLPDRVKRISLDIRRIATNRFEGAATMFLAILRLRRAVRTLRPDVVISFIEIMNVATLLTLAGTKVPVIVSERIDPREYLASGVLNRLRRWLYPRAFRVVVQTESVRAWAEQIVPPEQVVVIPNPIARPPDGAAAGNVAPGSRTAVAMGRLVTQKAFDLLIEAFAHCAESHPNWSLLILGDGEERDNLAALAKRLGLGGRVCMPGRVTEPADFLRGSDLFVLSSRYEGFPNALCEAMSVGLPVISTDCPSGPGEIVRNGIDGVLVPTENVEALSAAMDRLMGDCQERQRLGRAATQITERFGVDAIMRLWGSLLPDVNVPESEIAREER